MTTAEPKLTITIPDGGAQAKLDKEAALLQAAIAKKTGEVQEAKKTIDAIKAQKDENARTARLELERNGIMKVEIDGKHAVVGVLGANVGWYNAAKATSYMESKGFGCTGRMSNGPVLFLFFDKNA